MSHELSRRKLFFSYLYWVPGTCGRPQHRAGCGRSLRPLRSLSLVPLCPGGRGLRGCLFQGAAVCPTLPEMDRGSHPQLSSLLCSPALLLPQPKASALPLTAWFDLHPVLRPSLVPRLLLSGSFCSGHAWQKGLPSQWLCRPQVDVGPPCQPGAQGGPAVPWGRGPSSEQNSIPWSW